MGKQTKEEPPLEQKGGSGLVLKGLPLISAPLGGAGVPLLLSLPVR